MKTSKRPPAAKAGVKMVCLLLLGIIWPFAVAAVATYTNIYIMSLPDWTFWLVGVPVMALALIPVTTFLLWVLPANWKKGSKWLAALIVTGGVGFGLFCLIMLFIFWFHFAIGGSC